MPGFARLDTASSARSFVSSFALVLSAGLLVAAVLSPLARPAVEVVYTDKWLRSASVLGVLAVFGAMRVVFDLMATFLIARGGSRPVLLVQIVWVAVLVPAMILGVHFGGIVGAGVAHVVVAVAVVLPAYLFALRRQGVTFPALVRDAAPPVCAAAVTGLSVWLCSQVFDRSLYALVVGGSVGLLVYVGLLHKWLRARLSGGDAPIENPPPGQD